MLNIKVKSNVDLPLTWGPSGFEVQADRILRVVRGGREIEASALEKVQKGFEEVGYIRLRSLERILFGTGVYVDNTEELEFQVNDLTELALDEGLLTLKINAVGPDNEIVIALYNSTPFLSTAIKVGDKIAAIYPREHFKPPVSINV